MGFNTDKLQQTSSPLTLMTGTVGTPSGAPVAANGATATTALDSVGNAIKAPLSQKGSLVGDGGSRQGISGASTALRNYSIQGASAWKPAQ